MGWIEGISAAVSLASAFMGAESKKEAGEANAKATNEAAAWNAKISEYDAQTMEQSAKEIQYVTGLQLVRHSKFVDSFIGKQKAKYGKSGVALGTGSPLDVVAYSAEQGNLDSQTIRYEGEKAKERALSAAKRYRLLKSAGLRDAAATASIIEDTANDASTAQIIQGLGNFTTAGTEAGWWG